jgi:hypothetical protein
MEEHHAFPADRPLFLWPSQIHPRTTEETGE